MSKRILLLYNGGTIGMVAGSAGLRPSADDAPFRRACDEIFAAWPNAGRYTLDHRFLTAKDSLNLTHVDWTRLIYLIADAQDSGIDGVIVAHGTDTLAYSATAVALGLHGPLPHRSGLRIPVIFTGAQLPIETFGGDGSLNLARSFMALEEAIATRVGDVLISFGTRILLGTRTLKVSSVAFDAFASPFPAGQVGGFSMVGATLNPRLVHRAGNHPLIVQPHFADGVTVVELGPNRNPEALRAEILSGLTRAIVLKSPGEGNLPTEGAGSFLDFIGWATGDAHVPVVIASQFEGGSTGAAHYEVGRLPLQAGAAPAYDMTHVAADVKLQWLLAMGITDTKELRHAMSTSYAGEVTPNRRR